MEQYVGGLKMDKQKGTKHAEGCDYKTTLYACKCGLSKILIEQNLTEVESMATPSDGSGALRLRRWPGGTTDHYGDD